MNKLTTFKKIVLGFTSLAAGLVITGASANALPYTGASTNASPVPAFDVYTPTSGNPLPAPAPSDGENDFLQGRVPVNGNASTDVTTPYTDPVSTTCTNNEIIQMRVYVHNGAAAANNDNGSGPSVAHGTKVQVSLPTTDATTITPTATISATNAATVKDGLTINCNGVSAKVQYVAGSASQYSVATNAATPLSDSIVTSGASIQSEHVPGDVWGCWNDRVLVVLSVKVVITPPVIHKPVTPSAMCDFLTVDAQSDRTVKVATYKSTTSNAVFRSAVINWGDTASTGSITNESKIVGQNHQYAAAGTYDIVATISYLSTVDHETVLTSAPKSCTEQVTFSSTQPPVVVPPVTPPTTPTTPTTPTPTPAVPTQLVNTGAGNVVGLFAATSAIGAIGYRFFLGRRLSRG